MSLLSQRDIDEIIHFACEHYSYSFTDYRELYRTIVQHAVYDTMIVVRDDDGTIVSVCRWNILPTGRDAVILDAIIRPDYQNQGLLSRMLLKGLEMYPSIRYIIFERREEGKPFKKIPVARLIKRRF